MDILAVNVRYLAGHNCDIPQWKVSQELAQFLHCPDDAALREAADIFVRCYAALRPADSQDSCITELQALLSRDPQLRALGKDIVNAVDYMLTLGA